jgi:ubiquinone/menaquinone biosynthesis C-methylase UbiE
MMEKWRAEWQSPDFGKAYGDLFFKRAVGEAPEMECSKAAAKRMAAWLQPGDHILDAGCGVGHYYASLRKTARESFRYTGVDATPYYIERAREAFAGDKASEFVRGDIRDLPFNDRSFDLVMCNNVLLHLPSISQALIELCRVAKRHVLIRTLVGPKSYVIYDVAPQPGGEDFDENCDPVGFHYLNIYSDSYIRYLAGKIARVERIDITPDREFDASQIADTKQLLPGAWDATCMVGELQASGMILQPWSWLQLSLKPE